MSDSTGGGVPAPDFTLETATGETVRLSDLRGRNVVLFFVREFT
jgi:peroxiredoxin